MRIIKGEMYKLDLQLSILVYTTLAEPLIHRLCTCVTAWLIGSNKDGRPDKLSVTKSIFIYYNQNQRSSKKPKRGSRAAQLIVFLIAITIMACNDYENNVIEIKRLLFFIKKKKKSDFLFFS